MSAQIRDLTGIHMQMLLKTMARLSWRLAGVGVRVTPYYWYQENFYADALPPLEDEADFSFGFLDAADLKALAANDPTAFPEERLGELLGRLGGGRRCFGAKFRDQIIAMTSIDFDRAMYLDRSAPLAVHEAYLGDMFTRREFRGRNIAPHLRQRDQPRPATVISRVIEAHLEAGALITSPRFEGRGGHPLIFAASLRAEMEAISEETEGIREVFQAHRQEVNEVPVDDPVVRLDLNTPEDYERARRLYGSSLRRSLS